MFSEYLNLQDYVDNNPSVLDPMNEDWGAVLNHAITNAPSNSAFYFPFRETDYLVQSTILINRSILLVGAGLQEERGVVLRYKHNSPNPNLLEVGIEITSSNVVIQGIYFGNEYASVGRVRIGAKISASKVRIENCTFFYFEQKGIEILSGADSWYLKNVKISGNGLEGCKDSGLHVQANMGYAAALNILALEGSAIVDESTLGNTYIGGHTNQTGTTPNLETGAYVINKGLMIGNYAENNQDDIYVGEEAQLWNGHTGLPVLTLEDLNNPNISGIAGSILEPRYEQFSFACSSDSNGIRFENHVGKPVFLTFGGREELTLFEFVSLDDIFSQKNQVVNPDYLGFYENELKQPYNRWRLRFDNVEEVYKWYFENINTPAMIFSGQDDFEGMELRHIGFAGYYLPKNRSAIFVGAAASPNNLPTLAGKGSFLFNSNPVVLTSGTASNENYAGWIIATNANGQEQQIGFDLLED